MFVEAPVTVNHILTHAIAIPHRFCDQSVLRRVLFLLAAWALYVLLKPVNKDLALLFLLFNLAGFAVWLFSSLCLFASLVILNGAETIKAFQPDQLQALAVFFCQFIQKRGLYRPGALWRLALSPRLPGSQIGLSSKDPRGCC